MISIYEILVLLFLTSFLFLLYEMASKGTCYSFILVVVTLFGVFYFIPKPSYEALRPNGDVIKSFECYDVHEYKLCEYCGDEVLVIDYWSIEND